MNYSIRVGDSEYGFVTGSLSDWFHVLVVLGLCACVFAAFGAIVGLVFRRYVHSTNEAINRRLLGL